MSDSRIAGVVLGVALLGFAQGCSSYHSVSPRAADLTAGLGRPEGVAIRAYGGPDGARTAIVGRVVGFGDSLLFIGEVPTRPSPNLLSAHPAPPAVSFLAPRDSVAYLEVKRFDLLKTSGLVALGLVGAFVAIVIAWSQTRLL